MICTLYEQTSLNLNLLVTLTVLLFAVRRILDKKRIYLFCATSVFDGVSSGRNVGGLNRLTGKMINRRKGRKKS